MDIGKRMVVCLCGEGGVRVGSFERGCDGSGVIYDGIEIYQEKMHRT